MIHRLRNTEDNARSDDAVEPDSQFAAEPSWFLEPANDRLREALTERYRQSRHVPAPAAQLTHRARRVPRQWADCPDSIECHPRPPSRFLQNNHEPDRWRRSKRQDRPTDTTRLAGTFVIAAVVAALCGGTAGVINANLEPLAISALSFIGGQRETATAQELKPTPHQSVTHTVIAKKPISTATLHVNDVSGKTNSLIPLALHAEPALQGQDLLLRISGLPDKAYLTAGQKYDLDWTVAMDDLKNLKLVMPEDSNEQVDVAVAAFERNTGELAAPIKSMKIALSNAVVQPASAPPPSVYVSSQHSQPVQGQLAAIPDPASMGAGLNAKKETAAAKAIQGDGLMAKGDITGARKLFAEAWSLGSGDGAYGLGRSYDPVVLAVMKVGKTAADSSSAIHWYERAAAAGKTEAIGAIVRLRLKPN